MSGRRIELSATQVIASLLAAVTGAVAASFLGVAGTIIGTAVMSVASTAVAAVYKGGLVSSRERLRAAADARFAPLVPGHLVARNRAAEPGQDASAATTREDLPRAAVRRDRGPGPDDETQILPAVASGPRRWDDTDRANGLAGAADGATHIVRHPGLGRPDEPGGAGARPDDGGAAPRDARWRPRPLVLAGIALGVFVLAMAGITAFEAVAGKPLNTLVAGGHGSGTTIGSIVGGPGSQTAPRHPGPAHRSQGTSPTPHASTSPAPATTPSQAPTPSPAPTPTPTPSASPGASPATSPSAAASPARAPATPASGAGP
jgi:hypothetical protein